MCGIGGFVLLGNKRWPNKVDDFASALLMGLDHRGKDACGYLAVTDGDKYHMQKAACRAAEFNEGRRVIPKDSRTVILHTRFATQGHQGFVENNHPVYHSGIYVTHNGHISNDYLLFADNQIEREAQVDSEAIPAMVGHFGWDSPEKAFKELRGHYAVAMVHSERPNELILARGSNSPLVVLQTKDALIWASEKSAIVSAWTKCFGTPPADNKFRVLPEGTMLKIVDGVITEIPFEFHSWSYGSSSRSSYSTGTTGWSDSDWDDSYEDYWFPNRATGSGSGKASRKWERRALVDDPNWVRIGESSFRKRTLDDIDDTVMINYRYAYRSQKTGDEDVYIESQLNRIITFTKAELEADDTWIAWGEGYRKRDGFVFRDGFTTNVPWKEDRVPDIQEKLLSAAADKILASQGISCDLPKDEVLIRCHSCGQWENCDDMEVDGNYLYCGSCQSVLEEHGILPSTMVL